MRYLIFGLILLALSVYLGVELSKTPNTMMIIYDHWVIQSTLSVTIACIIALFIGLYVFFRLFGGLLGIPERYRQWRKASRLRKAYLLTHDGLCELAKGNWQEAEETLINAAKKSRNPLINYLAGAKAAHAQHAFDRRDSYLQQAHQTDSKAWLAIGLTQAQLQIDASQWEHALATLQHLRQKSPSHGFILKLLTKVLLELHEYSQCLPLLQPLKKSQALSKHEYVQVERTVYSALLQEATEKELTLLEQVWKSIPKEYRRQPEFINVYVSGLLKWQQDEIAYHLVVSNQKRCWDSHLAERFGQIRHNDKTQLEIVERWLQDHPHDSKLLLTAGELCLHEKLWGKAKDYLQQCVTTTPSVAGYIKLGNLYETLGEITNAQACYREIVNILGK